MLDCETLPLNGVPVRGNISRYQVAHGTSETHVMLLPVVAGPVERQLADLEEAYARTLRERGLSRASAVFRRLFTSDLVNQAEAVRGSWLAAGPAVSVVEQAPLPEAKVALHAYHVTDLENPPVAKACADGGTEWHHNGAMHLLATGITAPGSGDAYAQMREAFLRFEAMLLARGMTLAEHAVRTWIYVQNLDTDYTGVVRARRELFAERGLTAETHYIASTGIAGGAGDPAIHVALDGYAIRGLRPGQVQHLHALTHLSPTHVYGVTFERGTALIYGDRRHVLLSGTASIDAAGEIVHGGDVLRQMDRTIENMEALLREGGAGLSHLTHMLIYLRDVSDWRPVEAAFRERFPDLPCLVLQAPVCRPGWLIELEGTAIVEQANDPWPRF